MNVKEEIIQQLKDEQQFTLDLLQGYLRASGAGQCRKKRRYELEGYERGAMSVNSLLTTTFGNVMHEYLQSILKRRFGKRFILEKRLVNKRLGITGAFDGLIYTEDKKFILLDFKTTNPYKLKHLKEQQSADKNHLKQIVMYYHLLKQNDTLVLETEGDEAKLHTLDHYVLLSKFKRAKDEDIMLKIIYIMRDAINIVEFSYSPQDLMPLLEQELNDIKRIQSLSLDRLEKTSQEWECKYCPFLELCGGNGDVKVNE
jgi:CRISPR/Cas system-associated exonuclease Cas4 (RecB family)